jgi:2-hydroxychromene-2-carboxylate isomerase
MALPRTLPRITFWFDPISPYAWLALQRLPQALEGISHVVEHRPVLLGALLNHWGQKGPAELEPKRAWTFRQVQWLAHQQGTPLQTPAQHPFNPLPLLRLLVACGETDAQGLAGCNRRDTEAVFQHVWQGDGADANAPERLEALVERLAPQQPLDSPAVKQALRANTEAAIAAGVFGVPSLQLDDGRLFWGLDALPMLAAALRGDPWFNGPAWAEAGAPRPGLVRAPR